MFWLIELVRNGLRNLLRQKLRSTLTLLGVVFGVAAVITMMAVGEGGQRTVLREISALGLKNIILDSVQPPATSIPPSSSGQRARMLRYGITDRDVAQIRAARSGAADVVVAHLVKKRVYVRNRRVDARTLGVTTDYFALLGAWAADGRLIAPVDEAGAHRVAVLSEAVAEDLKTRGLLRGRRIKVGGESLSVVGTARLPGRSDARLVFIPLRTARTLYGRTTIQRESGSFEFTRTEVGQVVVREQEERTVPAAAQVIRRILDAGHDKADVTMSVPLDMLRSKQRMQRILNLVLVSIAAISLLVGGIGIMNIMLAIVTERIPEIGLRRAIGASRSDILLQFLTETVTLATLGGIVGCVLGIVMVPVASTWTGWSGVVTPTAVLLSLGVSWVVGLVFGLAPALRAARMHPVEALRHE